MTTESNNNNNPLPEPQTAVQQMMEELRPYLLDPRESYPEPYYMLEYNGVPFSTLGGIQAISGQKKNGKSFVLTMLMAAVLRGDPERSRVAAYLPGLTVPQRTIDYLGHEPRVLYVDTEMEKLYTAKVLRRVHWLCGWDLKQPNDRFNVLWLKTMPRDESVPAYKQRIRLIKNAIEVFEPDILFIDGLRDLLQSINEEIDTIEILDYLASTAEYRRMCIWNALHQNPRGGSSSDDGKMRGWTGTELGNKVSDTLVSRKEKKGGAVTFTVKQEDARGKDMDDWQFVITDDAGNLGIPKIVGGGGVPDASNRDIIEADDYFRLYAWSPSGATYTELERHLRSKGVTSNRRIKNLFDTAMSNGIIYRSEKKKYHYNGLQRRTPNDKPEDLPFDWSATDDAPF